MNKPFGERLRWAVGAAGWDGDAEAARNLEIHERTFNTYTNGRVPKDHILRRIADKLGVSVGWLLTGEGHPMRDHDPVIDQIIDSPPPAEQGNADDAGIKGGTKAGNQRLGLGEQMLDKKLDKIIWKLEQMEKRLSNLEFHLETQPHEAPANPPKDRQAS